MQLFGKGVFNVEKITFTPDGQEPVEFYVIEQTRLGGINYLLVSDEEEGDADAYILKEISSADEEDSVYEMISDDNELAIVAGYFEELLEDIDLVSDDSEE